MALITLTQAKDHLRVDNDAHDADIQVKLEAASAMVLDYIKADPMAFQNSALQPVGVPAPLKAATLIWLGILFKHRDGGSDETLHHGEVPRAVSNILWLYRTPTLR